MTTTELLVAEMFTKANAVKQEDQRRTQHIKDVIEYTAQRVSAMIKKYSSGLQLLATTFQQIGWPMERSYFPGWTRPMFVTDGIAHKVGFVMDKPHNPNDSRILGLGIEAGGCDGDIDLLFDFDGKMISRGQVCEDGRAVHLNKFAKDFERFVEDVYKYATEYISK